MKKIFALSIVSLLCMGVFAQAACSQEEMMAKAQAFMTAVQTMSQKNPQKAQEVAMSMQKDLPELQKKAGAGDMDGVCKFYDEWAAKMQ